MAKTVDPETLALLSQSAADNELLPQNKPNAERSARRKERFFRQMAAGYARMTDAERAEDAEEAAQWDRILADGD
jgi:hypothetical protein